MCCPAMSKEHIQFAICFAINEALAKNDIYRIESVVQGHYIYKTVWTPRLGEELETQKEPNSQHNQFGVAAVKENRLWGMCLWRFQEFHDTFLSVGLAKITDKIKLSEKGLEVSCTYLLTGEPSHVQKLIQLFLRSWFIYSV